MELERELRDARHARVAPFDTFRRILPGLRPKDKEFILDELYQGSTAVDLRCGECERRIWRTASSRLRGGCSRTPGPSYGSVVYISCKCRICIMYI